MKKLCIALTIALMAGCQSASNTEINRPSPDIGHTRQLFLKTTTNPQNGEAFASAAYSDGTAAGFGPGVFITCNSFPIIDTRNGASQQDTSRFISESSTGVYEWIYQGLDTNFVFDMQTESAQDPVTITEPREDTDRFPTGTLNISYQPTQPCTNLQVILLVETQQGIIDTILPVTHFDSTGVIAPIPISTLGITQGSGAIYIGIMNRTGFSTSWTHSIIVEDSEISRSSGIEWE